MSSTFRSPRRRHAAWLTLVVALGALVVASSAPAARPQAAKPGSPKGGTPIPTVTGPIPITPTSYPFTAEGTDLAANGYTLEEYFVSGKANVYDWGADGQALKPQVRTANAPYTTRILVRRPVKAHKFSGNVWVEMNNPSRRWDIEVEWPTVQEKVMRDGDIWVAVTVKPIVIAALKRFDAHRYGSLAMNNPLPPAQQTCGALPGEPGYDENISKLWENGLSWDIFSQVGVVARGLAKNNPLRGYRVKNVFATGESQTATYLNNYAYNHGSDAKLANGDYVYDGYVSVSSSGSPGRINQCTLLPAGLGKPLGTVADPSDPRTNLPAKHPPYILGNSQAETFSGYRWRRPDSDAPGAGRRYYEIAGAPHGPTFITNFQPRPEDVVRSGLPGFPTMVYTYGCEQPRANSFPRQYLEPAWFANMERWVEKGTPPPHNPGYIEVTNGGTPQVAFVTDQFGNVKGGIRSSYLDVPFATYYTTGATLKPGYQYCSSFGTEVLFGSELLGSLYGTPFAKQNYVAAVRASVAQMLAGRWVLPEDAAKIILEAELRPIP
jgi:hypothetical protein